MFADIEQTAAAGQVFDEFGNTGDGGGGGGDGGGGGMSSIDRFAGGWDDMARRLSVEINSGPGALGHDDDADVDRFIEEEDDVVTML